MPSLREMLGQRQPLILDGAMGTELQRRGVDLSLPLWSARSVRTNPDIVRQIHLDYLAAGADILTTNTFRTTRRTFQRAHLPDESAEYTEEAVALARQAIQSMPARPLLLAGSMAPLEDCYRPDLAPSDYELRKEHDENANRLVAAGVDFLLVETMGTLREALAACTAGLRTGKEVVVSFLCSGEGHLYGGDWLEKAVRAIEPLGPTALALNCIFPYYLDALLTQLRALTRLPIGVYANAGRVGEERSGTLIEGVSPSEYGDHAARWAERGAAIIGGCCGTTPAHIQQITKRTHWEFKRQN